MRIEHLAVYVDDLEGAKIFSRSTLMVSLIPDIIMREAGFARTSFRLILGRGLSL